MSSLKQIEANRHNAFKSTGPKTIEGKERSRRNALRHGLTAETIITAFEDAQDYQAFEAVVISDYDAQSAVERELVLRLASALWRLRRATGIESALFEPEVTKRSDLKTQHLLPAPPGRETVGSTNEPEVDTKKLIADSFLRMVALPTYPLDRLSRYEHAIWRQARQIVSTLESLRSSKQRVRRASFPFSFRAGSR